MGGLPNEVWVTFPLIKGVEACVISQRERVDWLGKDDFKIEYFSHIPQSLPLIEGVVKLKHVRGNLELTNALVNSFFHNCYPESYSVWSISEPKEESISNSIYLAFRESLYRMRKIYIEIDLDTNKMVITGQ